jgi:hypothetical protein
MVPMYLDRWIYFYMDINDKFFAGAKGRCKSLSINQCYAGTKKKQKMFKDETHSEEIPSECVEINFPIMQGSWLAKTTSKQSLW